jgi:hypothetical protein
LGAVFLGCLGWGSGSLPAETMTTGGQSAMTLSYPAVDPARAESRVQDRPYGHLIELSLPEVAPYPDDSRTTGFLRRNGQTIPYPGHYDDPTVAVVVPPLVLGIRAGQPLDAIIHFHGHLNTAANAIETQDLGGQVARSGRPILLIVPQGPKNAQDSGIGKLEKPGGFGEFLAGVEQALNATGPLAGRRMRLGNLAVSGHSGGYYPVSFVIQKSSGAAPTKIREVWLMDAAYGRLPELAAGFTGIENGRRTVRSVFTQHLEDENMTLLSLLGRADRPALIYGDAGDGNTTPTARIDGNISWIRHPLDERLRRQPVVMIKTELDHSGLMYEREYFRRIIEAGNLGRGTSR